jgi:anti-sigma regulatory factor (Ser/Thr protein kinase)
VKTRLAGDERAPRAARAYVVRQLETSALPDGVLAEDVVLITSELVTNAVRAGAHWIDLTLRISRRRLELLVADDADGRPVLVEADDDATRGRGLGIVDHWTDAWEVTPRARGKVVTATWGSRTDASR